MPEHKIDIKDLGVNELCMITIDQYGNSILYSKGKSTITDREFHVLLEEIFVNEELFISEIQNNKLSRLIKKIVEPNNYFCRRYNFKKSHSIYIFGMFDFDNSNLYLRSKKTLLYKLALFIRNRNEFIKSMHAKKFRIDIDQIINKKIAEHKTIELWKSLTIKRYPVKHKITQELVLLSEQQSKILISLVNSDTSSDIFRQHGIKPKTTEYYLQLIKAKTGYSKRIELICAFVNSNPWLKASDENCD